MGKNSKQKYNKRQLCPPLTFLDKCIYFLCIIISSASMLLLVYCFGEINNAIAFGKANTIAYSSNASLLFALPFVLFLELSTFVLFIIGLELKKPIFGSKKYRYGEYPFRKDCIPLFHRKKYNTEKTPSKKKLVRKIALWWCAGLFLCACLIPFSLFGRTALYQDNHVERINVVNLTSDTYTTDDFAHLTVKAQYGRGYRGAGYWKYEITIEMKDGRDFSFSNRDFDWRQSSANDICLDKMLEIKSLFDSEAITICGADNTDEVADYLAFNESQRNKLNELFRE